MLNRAVLQPPQRVRTGKVRGLATEPEATFISLDIPADEAPLESYFALRPDAHRNYNAMYSLVLLAIANNYDLTIRTSNDITAQAHGEVGYLRVDLPSGDVE